MGEGMEKRKTERDGVLAERFIQNSSSIEKYVWQDEKRTTREEPFN